MADFRRSSTCECIGTKSERLGTVKQRDDDSTSKRSHQQTKKDGANFWIHSRSRDLHGRKSRRSPGNYGSFCGTAQPDTRWGANIWRSLDEPTLAKGLGRCQEQ